MKLSLNVWLKDEHMSKFLAVQKIYIFPICLGCFFVCWRSLNGDQWFRVRPVCKTTNRKLVFILRHYCYYSPNFEFSSTAIVHWCRWWWWWLWCRWWWWLWWWWWWWWLSSEFKINGSAGLRSLATLQNQKQKACRVRGSPPPRQLNAKIVLFSTKMS